MVCVILSGLWGCADGKLATIDSSGCGTGTCLTYDALGRMVEKNVAGTYTEIVYSPLGTTATVSGQSTSAYVPLPGRAALFEQNGGNSTVYLHKDWRGSVPFGSRLGARNSYVDHFFFPPFGEVSGANPLDFSGDTQDTIAGTYDTPNRELNPRQARWISPDPAGLNAVDPTNPQSWNRYAYVDNNPLSNTDPLGLKKCPECVFLGFSGGTCGLDNVDTPCNIVLSVLQTGGADSITRTSVGGAVSTATISTFENGVATLSGGCVTSEGVTKYGETPGSSGASCFPNQVIDISANNSSWGWNFTKAFFGGLVSSAGWKSVYHSIVDEGGCDQLMFTTLAGDFVPIPTEPAPTDAVEPAVKFLSLVTYNRAVDYAVTKGLTYPYKSSVFRGLLSTSEGIEASVQP